VRQRLSTSLAGATLAFVLCSSMQAQKATLDQVNSALQAGEADKALTLLQSLPSAAEAHNLRCRVLFTLEKWNAAVDECQKAVDMDAGNSDYHMWLGRALGEKADRASFLSAFSLGKRVHSEFELAVELDSRNASALADLGEFDYSAPGIVGGGMDKAEQVAQQLDHVDPVRAAELRGHIAEAEKDYDTAERYMKQAIAHSSHPSFQWMTLASYYRRRKEWGQMQQAVESGYRAAQHERHAGVALYNGASILFQSGRDFDLAAKIFHEYLNSSSQTEEAPAFVADTRLARLEYAMGDISAAKRDKEAALELAHEYKPAQQLKF
jgi:tetratricopeptide (TPR) repeat protein